jgi:hypothetical protein
MDDRGQRLSKVDERSGLHARQHARPGTYLVGIGAGLFGVGVYLVDIDAGLFGVGADLVDIDAGLFGVGADLVDIDAGLFGVGADLDEMSSDLDGVSAYALGFDDERVDVVQFSVTLSSVRRRFTCGRGRMAART